MGRPIAAGGRLCVRRQPRHRRDRRTIDGFCGILQVDGYAAYKARARGHGGAIQLAFCLVHARRRFVDVYKTTRSPFAQKVSERLQAVYAIEAEIRGSSAEATPCRPL